MYGTNVEPLGTNVNRVVQGLRRALVFQGVAATGLMPLFFFSSSGLYNYVPFWLRLTSANSTGQVMSLVGFLWSLLLTQSGMHVAMLPGRPPTPTRQAHSTCQAQLPLFKWWYVAMLASLYALLLASWVDVHLHQHHAICIPSGPGADPGDDAATGSDGCDEHPSAVAGEVPGEGRR